MGLFTNFNKKSFLSTRVSGKKTIFLFVLSIVLSGAFGQTQSINTSPKSSSTIDWVQEVFSTKASLNLKDNKIPFPSGKDIAINRISMALPFLLKDPLLSIPVDSSTDLGDIVLQNTVTLEQLTSLIDSGRRTPGAFSSGLSTLEIQHSLSITDISALMIKHSKPYAPQKPIELVSSRAYSGIIIDARGMLPVQGEFINEQAVPCLFPKIWDDTMELLYERNMMDSTIAKTQGIVTYSYSDDESSYVDRIGNDPLRISARKIFGINRTDPVISRKDALRILSIPSNLELLKQGKIVILMDKEMLIHEVETQVKDPSYYVTYQNVELLYDIDAPEDTLLDTTPKGIRISIQKLKFVADAAELLPEEQVRLDSIAELLKTATKDNDYTITVDGHTASVGKPEGEQALSVERAKSIVNEMIARGLSEDLFSYQGYGGTMPVANNSTNEGRAQNRRVEITIVPKTTYIRRE